MNNRAPIVLFVYNRPWHTRQTLEALQKNIHAEESELFIYADGPKSKFDIARVEEVRDVIAQSWKFKKIRIIGREKNWGLAENIIDGVSQIVSEYGKVIVLEDDLYSSVYFLKYMNEALDLYQAKEDVACISGYLYPVKNKLPDTFFIYGADCWGWATWAHSWALFEKDSSKLLQELEKQSRTKEFDFSGRYPFTQMLIDQINGRNQSWAIRWYASAFVKNKLCLYPSNSLIHNFGMDGSGTHKSAGLAYDVSLSDSPIRMYEIETINNKKGYKEFSRYFKSQRPGILLEIKNWILSVTRKLLSELKN